MIRFKEWLYYLKKEQQATTASTKAVYSKLKELNRDKVIIGDDKNGSEVLEFLNKQINKNEEKLSILMNLEVDLPEFYD